MKISIFPNKFLSILLILTIMNISVHSSVFVQASNFYPNNYGIYFTEGASADGLLGTWNPDPGVFLTHATNRIPEGYDYFLLTCSGELNALDSVVIAFYDGNNNISAYQFKDVDIVYNGVIQKKDGVLFTLDNTTIYSLTNVSQTFIFNLKDLGMDTSTGFNGFNLLNFSTENGSFTITEALFLQAGEEETTTEETTTEEITTEEITTTEETTIEETTKEVTTTEGTTGEIRDISVSIDGFQVSAINKGMRTVYTVNSSTDNYVRTGLIYGLADYASEEDIIIGSKNDTVYSFESTESGIVPGDETEQNSQTRYIMTMRFNISNKEFYNTKTYVRAYAELEDGTYIYSEVGSYSIYEIADVLYRERQMTNKDGHSYLYNEILKIVNSDYQEVDYIENDSIIMDEE